MVRVRVWVRVIAWVRAERSCPIRSKVRVTVKIEGSALSAKQLGLG
jgi:hypothetical protein